MFIRARGELLLIEVNGPEGLRLGELRQPPTHPLRLPDLNIELQVWNGRVDFVLPISVDDRVVSLIDDLPDGNLELEIVVNYQACDDQVCRIPQTQTLHLSVPFARYIGNKLRV